MATEFNYDRETIVIGDFTELDFDHFKPELEWAERTAKLAQTAFHAPEFLISLKEASAEDDFVLWYAQQSPRNILELRVGLKDAMIKHAKNELRISAPIFSGRGATDVIYRGEAPRVGSDELIWGSTIREWNNRIGESMNNPFNYMYRRHVKYEQPSDHKYEQFVPMIAVFDSEQLELTDNNSIDRTSWRTTLGKTAVEVISGVYYFDPTKLVFQKRT